MNYTTLTRVKTALGGEASTSDTQLTLIIASVSRAIDRHCAGMVGLDDYFKLETITDELGAGIAAADSSILYMARKVKIQSVAAFAWRFTPYADWLTIDAQYVTLDGYMAKAWLASSVRGKVLVKLSYQGGLASSTDNLPADILDAADVLAVRFYKEIKSGLGDTIGVAELGTLQYTKALPARVVEMLKPYRRIVS